MAKLSVDTFLEKDRAKVQKTRTRLLEKRKEIDRQLEDLDLQLQAHMNYRLSLLESEVSQLKRSGDS